jgi:hypothetical protein
MPREKPNATAAAGELAKRVSEVLIRERVVPRFVDSYVVENGRHALQVHASLYRDLLTLLQREALLALTVRALAIVCNEPQALGKSKPRPMLRRDASTFRRKFLTSLTRQQGWTAGAAAKQRPRKPYEAADHPFVDRCAFLLDSSFIEKARLAASRTLTGIEELAAAITEQIRGGQVL